MASGKLAGIDITSPNTDTQLYAVPSAKTASVTVCMTNRTGATVKVRLALTSVTSVANTDYVAFDVSIPANETYERSGLVVTTGQYIYARANATGISAVVFGYEDTAA